MCGFFFYNNCTVTVFRGTLKLFIIIPKNSLWSSYNRVKVHILELPFIVENLRHACILIMLSNQYFETTHRLGGWIMPAKCLLSDLGTFVSVGNILDLWVQLIKNGRKRKSLTFIFVFGMSIIIICLKRFNSLKGKSLSLSKALVNVDHSSLTSPTWAGSPAREVVCLVAGGHFATILQRHLVSHAEENDVYKMA